MPHFTVLCSCNAILHCSILIQSYISLSVHRMPYFTVLCLHNAILYCTMLVQSRTSLAEMLITLIMSGRYDELAELLGEGAESERLLRQLLGAHRSEYEKKVKGRLAKGQKRRQQGE